MLLSFTAKAPPLVSWRGLAFGWLIGLLCDCFDNLSAATNCGLAGRPHKGRAFRCVLGYPIAAKRTMNMGLGSPQNSLLMV